MHKSIAALLLIAVSLFAAPLGVHAADQGKVVGSLSYQGQRVALEHVLVVRYGNQEGTPQGAHLRVFLADRPIPLALASTVTLYSLRRMLHAAGANAVVLRTDARGRSGKAEVELLAAAGLPWPMSETASVADAFTRIVLGGGRLSGTVAVHRGDLAVEAEFTAPLAEQRITANFSGKAARNSAPARALIACVAAMRREDLDALGACFSDFDRKELERYRAAIGAEAFAKQAKSRPGASEFAAAIRRVVQRGDDATVVTGDDFVEMVRENGVWKVKG